MSAQILLVAGGGVADCMQTCKRCLTLYIQSKPIHCRKEAEFRGIYLTKNMSTWKRKPAALQNLWHGLVYPIFGSKMFMKSKQKVGIKCQK